MPVIHRSSVLTRTLAIVGTVLVWTPILAPVLFSAIATGRGRPFRIDYLMPAELFLVALAGSGLLIWAALRAHSRLRPICWGLGIAVGLLVASQVLAVLTGLASGEAEPAGVGWVLVLAMLGGYVLALVATGVAGVLLLRDLFKPSPMLIK